MLSEKILNTVLKDDDLPFGGTSFVNETVKDFLNSIDGNLCRELTLNELNTLLKVCGICSVSA